MRSIENDVIKELAETNKIKVLDDNINYWFVRTNDGENYDAFSTNNFIAIEWDELNDIDKLSSSSRKELKEYVERIYPKEERPGLIAGYILQFLNEMKVGDIVAIPSKNSKYIAFGEITGDAYELSLETESLVKRRPVKWLKVKPRRDIDPYLIPIIHAHNTIVDANPYGKVINRSIYNLYFQNKKLHATFKVQKSDNISAYDFSRFLDNFFECSDILGEITGEKYDYGDLTIKAAFNSPGPVEIITCSVAFFMVISGISLFLNGSKSKFDFKILNQIGLTHETESVGIIERIRQYNESKTKNQEKLKKLESNLEKSANVLKLERPKIAEKDNNDEEVS
jgi:hypothetical protein